MGLVSSYPNSAQARRPKPGIGALDGIKHDLPALGAGQMTVSKGTSGARHLPRAVRIHGQTLRGVKGNPLAAAGRRRCGPRQKPLRRTASRRPHLQAP